jgi:hypothetical protein
MQPGRVILQKSDKLTVKVPLSKLAEDDRKLAVKLAGKNSDLKKKD